MKSRKTETPKPIIKSILGGSTLNRGSDIKEAMTGDCIRIVGNNFGKTSKKTEVFFDEFMVKPFSFPFSNQELIVICPMVKKDTKSLRIQVGNNFSNAKRFKVNPPITSSEPVGTVTKRYFDTIDQTSALVAGFAGAIAPYTPYSSLITKTSEKINHTRVVLQTVNGLLMNWAPLQENLNFEPLKTIKNMDDIILQSQLTEGVQDYTDHLFGPEGPVFEFFGKDFQISDVLFGTAKDLESYLGAIIEETGIFSPELNTFYDAFGFFLHELTKVIEGGENVAKLFKPSAEVGLGAGLEGSVDVEFDWGQIFSALSKFIDVIAQTFTKISTIISSKQGSEKIDRLEEKADRERVLVFDLKIKLDHIEEDLKKLEEKLDKLEQKNDTELGKLDNLETKADREEEKLDRIGENIDRLEQKADRSEEKLDVLEMKSDKAEEKLDRLELKNDREEQKLDKVEEKLDKSEQKLDVLEQKADKAEEKLDRLEEKNDKEEQKLDKLEQKADKAEQKLDKIEQKNDKEEQKLDKLEQKADKAERKLDLLEQKADKAELKLDKLELKNDKEEHKLDKIEVKLDRFPIYQLPLESSIADQQSNNGRLTSAIVALKGNNRVYLKAAVDVTSDDLDNEAKWSAWNDFRRPLNAQILIDISIDLQYLENSSNLMNGVITARDSLGNIFIRTFKGLDHQNITKDAEWIDWKDFPGQP